MSEVQVTAESVMDSLTGHDEMAIAEYFGKTLGWLIDYDELMLGRALVFVSKRREPDTNDVEAREFALSMTFKRLSSYFAKQETPEEGKGEQVDEPQPETSLTSAS